MLRVALVGSIAVAALLAPPPLTAHDLWIAPSSFTPGPDETVRLRLMLGDGKGGGGGGIEGGHGPETFEAMPRDDAGIVRFVASGPRGDQSVPGLAGLDPAGFLRPPVAGWYTIVYESSPSFARLDADTFRAYLVERGLRPELPTGSGVGAAQLACALCGASDAPDTPPAVSTTELFRRSLKARILVLEPGATRPPSDPGEAAPAGLPLELVMERVLPVGELSAQGRPQHRVALRLLLEGVALAGAQVDLRRLDGAGAGATLSTDGEGRLDALLQAGTWLATAVHLDASRPGTADWESVWASLTFELR